MAAEDDTPRTSDFVNLPEEGLSGRPLPHLAVPHRTENGLPVEVAAALARVPTCGWHHGQYPDLCWWCGLNQVHTIPPAETEE